MSEIRDDKLNKVIMAMLSVQRHPWEQGVCMQAMNEYGDINTMVAMASDAVLKQSDDGRLGFIYESVAVTDPASCGEGVLEAYKITGDEKYKIAADKMADYLVNAAPKTDKGILCHNTESFVEGFSPYQIWADAIYMAPPFLYLMGYQDMAIKQVEGMYDYLVCHKSGLLRHIYDAQGNCFVRDKLWATGNTWAILGMGRIIDMALAEGDKESAERMISLSVGILDNLIKYILPDGRFHDILDDESSFIDGAAAMMMAAYIYRGVSNGWLPDKYVEFADRVYETMEEYVDECGIIREVCGSPHFVSVGTSAESMAAYIMMHSWKKKL